MSDDAINATQSAYRRLVEAEAAELAASTLLQAEDARGCFRYGPRPLGTPVQRLREYSTSSAYLGQTFPVTDEGTACVLCQQELTEC